MPSYKGYEVTFYDKAVHAVLFGVLAYLIVYALGSDKSKRLKLICLVSFLISAIYSGLSEYIQIYIPGRDVNKLDFLAALVGIILALIYAYKKFRTRKT